MNSTYTHNLSCQISLSLNQPTSLKMKNVHIFGIFQLIWLQFVMDPLNGGIQHMYLVYIYFSMLTGLTSLPPNQPTGPGTMKNLPKFDIFQPIWLKLGRVSKCRNSTYAHY